VAGVSLPCQWYFLAECCGLAPDRIHILVAVIKDDDAAGFTEGNIGVNDGIDTWVVEFGEFGVQPDFLLG